jgi:hypothetical protein
MSSLESKSKSCYLFVNMKCITLLRLIHVIFTCTMILDECVRDHSYLSYEIKKTGPMTLDGVMPEVSLGESDLSGWSDIIVKMLTLSERPCLGDLIMSHE